MWSDPQQLLTHTAEDYLTNACTDGESKMDRYLAAYKLAHFQCVHTGSAGTVVYCYTHPPVTSQAAPV